MQPNEKNQQKQEFGKCDYHHDHHTQAEYHAVPENRAFTLFLATGHQLARYNAFLFAK